MTSSDLTNGEEQFQNMKVWPLEESVGKETAEGLYFSDLTEEKLITLFCKSPSFRYELCSVHIKCDGFSKRPKMYGFIKAAECPSPSGGCLSSDMAAAAAASHYVFNRESNDPIVVRDRSLFLNPINCSVSASNYIQISAKLYFKACTEKEMEDEDEDEDEEEEEYEVKEYDSPFNENDLVKLFTYFTFCADGSTTLKSKDIVENDSNYDAELYKELEKSNLNLPPDHVPEPPIDLNEDEPFEVCDGNLVINLSDGWAGSRILIGNGVSLNLYYVALKYAVDAVIELEFDVHSKDIKLDGYVDAFYGNKFDYGCRHDQKVLYKPRLLDIRPHDFVKSGKLNLLQSVLAVPAQFSLIIDVAIRDDLTGKYIFDGPYEFFVPLNGGSSYGSIVGNDLTLRMKVDWKLPL